MHDAPPVGKHVSVVCVLTAENVPSWVFGTSRRQGLATPGDA